MYDQKCNETAVAETNYSEAMQDVLGKAEAFEKHTKTVTDSHLTTESDFCQTILQFSMKKDLYLSQAAWPDLLHTVTIVDAQK